MSLAAITDGVTANEPFWGNYGTTEKNGYVELDLGSAKSFDNVKVSFVSDRQAGGYREPARWWVQVPDGTGGWKPVPEPVQDPTVPAAKFNEALFSAVTTDKLRIAFTNEPGALHRDLRGPGVRLRPRRAADGEPGAGRHRPRDASADGNLSTHLVGTASDDGVPYDKRAHLRLGDRLGTGGRRRHLSRPARARRPQVTGTVAGDYVFRFFADDGEKRSEATVTVTLTERDVTRRLRCLGDDHHDRHLAVGEPPAGQRRHHPEQLQPGRRQRLGHLGPAAATAPASARAAWIQYAWDSPVRLSLDRHLLVRRQRRHPPPDGHDVRHRVLDQRHRPGLRSP